MALPGLAQCQHHTGESNAPLAKQDLKASNGRDGYRVRSEGHSLQMCVLAEQSTIPSTDNKAMQSAARPPKHQANAEHITFGCGQCQQRRLLHERNITEV
jgi:hypothetical protein